MVGFATIFVAASLAFAIVVQGFYRPQPLFEKARFVDEILGGLLGLLQAAIILGSVVIILDSFFRLSGIPQDPDEIDFLRNLWVFLDGSQIVDVLPRRRLSRRSSSSSACSSRATSSRCTRAAPPERPRPRDPDRRDAGGRAGPCSAPGWSATTTPAAGSGGSSRSRRMAGRTIARRTPGSGARAATGSWPGRPVSPTCTLSMGCTTV